jgi:hypothetical protein
MLLTSLLLPLTLSAIYLLSLQIAQPSTTLRPKIFVLGLSKTGTTSVGNALALLGYKRLGWKDIRSRSLVQTYLHGDLSALVEQTQYFDAFEDLPWPFVYREMAELYPDAKFILTLRRDEETWIRSLRRHMGRGDWGPAEAFYGAQRVEGNEEAVLGVYRNHSKSVRNYFERMPERYAELVVDDGDKNWEVLCRVALCPGSIAPTVGFPRSNTAEHWHDGTFVAMLHRLWGWTVTRIEDLTATVYYELQWPVVNRLLELVWHYISVVELAVCQFYFTYVVQQEQLLPVG